MSNNNINMNDNTLLKDDSICIIHDSNNESEKKIPEKEVDLEDPWNKFILQKLEKVATQCLENMWMHDYEESFCTKADKIFLSVKIIVLTIMGSLTSSDFIMFMTNSVQNESVHIAISIIQLAIFFVLCIVEGLYNRGNYKNRIILHHNSYTDFNEIYQDIDNIFHIAKSKRGNDSEYLKYKTDSFLKMLEKAPFIRPSTREKFLKATVGKKIYKPPLTNEYTIEMPISLQDRKNKYNKVDSRLQTEIDRWLNNL